MTDDKNVNINIGKLVKRILLAVMVMRFFKRRKNTTSPEKN